MNRGVIQVTVMFLMRPWIGSCKQTMARLSGHVEEDLPERQDRRIRRHLARCHRCQAAFESLVRVITQVRELGRLDIAAPMPSMASLVTERIRHDRE